MYVMSHGEAISKVLYGHNGAYVITIVYKSEVINTKVTAIDELVAYVLQKTGELIIF